MAGVVAANRRGRFALRSSADAHRGNDYAKAIARAVATIGRAARNR